jgi:hypothetical protein
MSKLHLYDLHVQIHDTEDTQRTAQKILTFKKTSISSDGKSPYSFRTNPCGGAAPILPCST